MANKKYLTISEFAKIKGVSNQAVYKQLSTKLSKYVVEVDNKKMLRFQVIADLGLNQVDNNSLNVDNQVDNQDDFFQFLKKQIEEKDKQIAKLQQNAEEKDRYIQEQGARLTDLIEQSNLLQQNNQMLLKMLTGATEESNNTVKDVVIEKEIETETNEQPEKKKGFFSKVFG